MPVMDDTEPGKASTRIARLVEHLRALPEANLRPFLATLDRATLATFAQWLPCDCNCPVRVAPCSVHRDKCQCPALPESCPHLREARRREWPLSIEVVFCLLEITDKEFLEPAKIPEPSPNTNPRAQVAIYAERRRRKQRLWHKQDWLNDPSKVDERLARWARRLRNGADEVGELIEPEFDDE